MDIGYNPVERQAFDAALEKRLAAVYPEAEIAWGEYHRRVFVVFPEGAVCSLWEPNFFFSYPSFNEEQLLTQATEAIRGQREMLAEKIDE